MFTRRAGEGLDLDPDVVVYMGRAAQGMPQDEGMDQRIADGFTRAVLKALEYVPERDGGELRTLEYVPERDGGELRTLEIRNEPKQMTPGEVREFFGGMDPGLGLDMGPYGGGVVILVCQSLDNYGALRHHVAPWFLAPCARDCTWRCFCSLPTVHRSGVRTGETHLHP